MQFNICHTFHMEKIHLKIAGFYSDVFANYKAAIKILNYFIVLLETIQFEATMAFAFAHTNNLYKLSETLLYSSTQIAFLSKMFNIIYTKNNFRTIEMFLSNEIFTNMNLKEKRIFLQNLKSVHLTGNFFRLLCLLVVVLYGVFPFFDSKNKRKVYPLPCLFPFNPDNYYVTVFIAELLSIAIGAWINSTIDILFCVLITIGKTLLEILCIRIRNITKFSSETDATDDQMKKCVTYHQDLLRYIDVVEGTFSIGIFVQFSCSVMVICLTGFQMFIIELKSVQFLLLFTYMFCMMCQIATYCWYGQLIKEKSDNLTTACYEMDWPNTNVKIKKMLILLMERAKRPVTIRAAGFFEINLSTFMKILKNSYSYMAVLQHLYSKD